jgi:hypothetical protein
MPHHRPYWLLAVLFAGIDFLRMPFAPTPQMMGLFARGNVDGDARIRP